MKILRWVVIVLILMLTVIFFVVLAFRISNQIKNRITTAKGIQDNYFVQIGDIDQYIQIRGDNIDNPLILFLHGGPGFPISYMSYMFQSNLEKEYTVVHWDQRNSGRTYYANANTKSILNIDLMLRDLDNLVDYLRIKYNKDKIILLGQSWGTVLGTQYVQMKPEKIEAYIGVGQVIDFNRGKIFAVEEALKTDILKSDEEKLSINEKIIEFSAIKKVEHIDVDNLISLIRFTLKNFPSDHEMNPIQHLWGGITSPTLNFDDLKWFMIASNTYKIFELQKDLIQYMYFDYDAYNLNQKFDVPMYLISGSNDWITPTLLAVDYFNWIDSPEKNVVVLEGAGHTPFLDMPVEFARTVKFLLK